MTTNTCIIDSINVDSKPDIGANFTILFPLITTNTNVLHKAV